MKMNNSDITYCDGKNCIDEYKLNCERFIGEKENTKVWMMTSDECLLGENKLFVLKRNNIKKAYDDLNKRLSSGY